MTPPNKPQRITVLLLLAIMLLSIGYALILAPEKNNLLRLEAQTIKLKNNLETGEQSIDEQTTLKEQIAILKKSTPPNINMSRTTALLTKLSNESRLRNIEIKPEKNKTIQLNAIGNYYQLIEFLQGLSKAQGLTTMQALTIENITNHQNLHFNLIISSDYE